MGRRRILVLDTSAFIAGFDPSAVDEDLFSVPSVRNELADRSLSKLRFETAAESGRLTVLEPSPQFLSLIRESSKEIGDMLYLSEADIHILALAMQLKETGHATTIVTDDYSIQNVAKRIKADFVPLATFGIRFYLQWLLYCPACRKKYPSDYRSGQCDVCGTRLKRKPQSKSPIEKAGSI
mgnify:CR=1 FL=1